MRDLQEKCFKRKTLNEDILKYREYQKYVTGGEFNVWWIFILKMSQLRLNISMIIEGDIVSHIPIILNWSILRTFFSETNKHRTMKLSHCLCISYVFFVNIGENLVPFMGINILINVKKMD